ncbi:PD-(D/E)XK nuclease family protein [Mycolicibacterium insubricum]|uniref:PD-(D/E)XK nuclease family protein n=1 Tax=Mycolicibacterium insubricum TaxID=444597 RepID=UPI003908A0B0
MDRRGRRPAGRTRPNTPTDRRRPAGAAVGQRAGGHRPRRPSRGHPAAPPAPVGPGQSTRCWAPPFHEWVQRYYRADRLFDLEDLPGAADGAPVDPDQLDALQAAFTASAWSGRTPVDQEVPFELALGNTVVRGRIDAVFAEPGEPDGFTVVDWKTGAPPSDEEALRHNAIQLAVYRIAWAGLVGCDPERVRGAFHYVRTGTTVYPDALPGAEELAALIGRADTTGATDEANSVTSAATPAAPRGSSGAASAGAPAR